MKTLRVPVSQDIKRIDQLSTDNIAMWHALKRIASYDSPDKLGRTSLRNYGLEPEEATALAYENVIAEAKQTLKVVRKPTLRRAAAGRDRDATTDAGGDW